MKKIFIENDKTYALFIPILIIIAFSTKGISLYLARSITIVLGQRVKQQMQNELTGNILLSDNFQSFFLKKLSLGKPEILKIILTGIILT